MHTDFPEWLLGYDPPPTEVRENILALLPEGPDAHHIMDTLCFIAHGYACDDRERRTYQDIYNRQKRKPGIKNPDPYTQHAGEELERIRAAALELRDAIESVRHHARQLLDKELRGVHRAKLLYTAEFDPANPRAGRNIYKPHMYSVGRETTLHQLHHIIDAIDGNADEGREGLLAEVGRRRRPEGIKPLVEDIGREYRYALKRVPTQSELTGMLKAIFGEQFARGTGYVKEWCKTANATTRESEKEENK
ncbi:hypothetical protein [Desulfobulbus alkaliphilus]|uniref:hypothetical protein n=1 Tax=Desulfobulbus alkaliphilus TaxID=869814 RepID=UPI001963F289|nr:hypothetical protein [Desulfobulbus alkaliphilus]MBM9536175.1 hypothetical protein [Desulfobulbus alkaliphilus]